MKLISEKNVAMTVSLAERILSLPPVTINGVDIDRHYTDNHTLYLMKCMERDKFHWNWVFLVTACCPTKKIDGNEPGTVFRFNGKHTCKAFLTHAAGNKTLRFEGPKLRHYECDDEEDMRELFKSLDRGLARSKADIVQATLGGVKGFEHVGKRWLKLLVSGLQLWQVEKKLHHSNRATLLVDDAAGMVRGEYKKLSSQVAYFLTEPNQQGDTMRKLFTRSSVVAALYATFNASGYDTAKYFWNVVKDCIGIASKSDPRYVLHNYLRETVINSSGRVGRIKGTGDQLADAETVYRTCLHCWNAWVQLKELKQKPRADKSKERPEVLTPKTEAVAVLTAPLDLGRSLMETE